MGKAMSITLSNWAGDPVATPVDGGAAVADEGAEEEDSALGLPASLRLEEVYDPEDKLLELTCCELKRMPTELLATMPDLKTLLLRQNPKALKGGDALAELVHLDSLTHLDVYESEVDDISALQKLPKLRHLDLS